MWNKVVCVEQFMMCRTIYDVSNNVFDVEQFTMCRTIYDVSKYFMKVAKRFALGSTFSSPFKVAARGDLSWKKKFFDKIFSH
jgi:hypothetical protein